MQDALKLCGKTVPCVYYKFHDKSVLVTHGGLSSLPENLIFVVAEQMINGVGEPEDASLFAEYFIKNTNEYTYQVHVTGTLKSPGKNGRTFNIRESRRSFSEL